MVWSTVAAHTGGNMRLSSSRATTAAVLVGLAVLAVAGRLLSTAPSTQRPATTATPTSAGATAPTTRGVVVPDAIGRTLAQATTVMVVAGLQGAATDRDPQASNAVVVAQEPPAGQLIPPNSVVGFRTRTDVQPNGTRHRLRLRRGPTTATYQVVAPDPARHQLTVAVTVPRATDVQVWLETGPSKRLPVLGTTRDATSCHPTGGQARCVVRFGALEAEQPGVWTVSVAKGSSPPAGIEVTVTFTPL
jgi:hypothetical protein